MEGAWIYKGTWRKGSRWGSDHKATSSLTPFFSTCSALQSTECSSPTYATLLSVSFLQLQI
jgi:hypothetical protein